MSMFVGMHKGEFMSFSKFMLSEAISPKKTVYGVNKAANDMKIDSLQKAIYYTVVKEKDMYYLVYFDRRDGEAGFGANSEFSGNPTIDEIGTFTDKQGQNNLGAGALKVFGKVFYVLLQITKAANARSLKFNAAHPKLGKVYSRMVENPIFLKALEKEGWEYYGQRGDDYLFTK